MGLLSLQVFSLAASVSIPLMLGLPQDYKTYAIYSILLLLLSTNAHGTLQQRQFNNNKYKLSIQSLCFAVMFLLSAYVYMNYSVAVPKN